MLVLKKNKDKLFQLLLLYIKTSLLSFLIKTTPAAVQLMDAAKAERRDLQNLTELKLDL